MDSTFWITDIWLLKKKMLLKCLFCQNKWHLYESYAHLFKKVHMDFVT